MNELQALLLGLVQGLTEYLPVSSSGHLAILSNLFDIDGESNLTFTITVHVATVMSTLVILYKEIWELLKGLFNTKEPLMSESRRYILAIVISMIPVGIVGLCFKDAVEEIFGSGLLIVGLCLLITALLLTFSYYAAPRQKENIGLRDAFIIGLAQAVAVLPGVSRSGSTIATGILLGNDKSKLAKFSFLMVIPPILGEALLDVLKMCKETGMESSEGLSFQVLAIGFAAAFVSGCAACKWMINLVRKGKLVYFGIYCAIVGTLLIISTFI